MDTQNGSAAGTATDAAPIGPRNKRQPSDWAWVFLLVLAIGFHGYGGTLLAVIIYMIFWD